MTTAYTKLRRQRSTDAAVRDSRKEMGRHDTERPEVSPIEDRRLLIIKSYQIKNI